MSGKFMKILKIAIPTLTLVLIASQLLNSCAVSPNELLSMYERQQAITIEVAEPKNQEQGTEKTLEWEELAFLETYPEFREVFDDTLGITIQGTNGKNGIVYVDMENNHTNNSTLRYAFANAKFLSNCWNNSEAIKTLTNAIQKEYTDITDDGIAKYAAINAYFNIFPDSEPSYFNGNQTLTRGEFLAGVFRAGNPVKDLETDSYFTSLVDPAGTDKNTIFATQLQDYSYLTTEDNSLNSGTYAGTITRAEAVYTIVKLYYANEFNSISGSESSFSDTKNGGDIATKVGFKDKETGTVKDYWKSYELSYALQNPDKGLPSDLYKALVVAKNHNLLAGTTSRWDEGITKKEALELITRTYESLGTIISADRGASTGNVVVNGNQGNENQNNGSTNNNETNTPEFNITAEDFYYNSEGKLEYTNELIEFVKTFKEFSDLDNSQICRIIESPNFENIINLGKAINNVQGCITSTLSDSEYNNYLIKIILGDTSNSTTNPAGNTGYGDTSKVEDSNKGGSEENEKTPGDEQQGIDNSDNVDEATGQLKPTATPIPTDTPSSTEEAPEIIVTTPEDQTPQFTYESLYKTMYATDAVNTRKGPSTDFDKTGNLNKGQQVTVIARCNETGWFMIQDGADIMFVTSKYLSETPPATPTPVPTEAPAPTEAPKPNNNSGHNYTTSNENTNTGKTETKTLTFTYVGVKDGKKVAYEEELTVQGTYIDGYFVADGLEDKVGFGVPISSDRAEIEAWREKYPNLEYTGINGVCVIFPAGRDLHDIGNYNGDGLKAN